MFRAVASSALVLGALAGVRIRLPKAVLAGMLAFAAGALITALSFELFEDAYERGGTSGPPSAWSSAAGAVLASLAETLMPEAYEKGGPLVALSTTAGSS